MVIECSPMIFNYHFIETQNISSLRLRIRQEMGKIDGTNCITVGHPEGVA
jgi:hypothetical protein